MGSRWICEEGAEPHPIDIGDLSYGLPGTTHRYGAGRDFPVRNLAIGLAGATQFNTITDEQYYKTIDGKSSTRLGWAALAL